VSAERAARRGAALGGGCAAALFAPLALALALAVMASQALAAPELRAVWPPAQNSGDNVGSLRLSGTNLSEVTALRFEPDEVAVLTFEPAPAGGHGSGAAQGSALDTLLVTIRVTDTSRIGAYDLIATWSGGEVVLPAALRLDPGEVTLRGLNLSAPERPWWRSTIIAAAFTVLPFALGAMPGVFVRRRRRRRVASAFMATALAAAAVAAAVAFPALSTWDLLLAGVLAAGGVFFGAAARRTRVGLAVSALILALTFEAGARLVLPEPPQVINLDLETTLVLRRSAMVEACQLLFPELGPNWSARFGSLGAEQRPVVVHLGDSMVQGEHGPSGRLSLVDELAAHDSARRHLNAGVGATSADFQLLLLERLLALRTPEAVVLYLYQNDPYELGQAYPCCGNGPLLAWTGGVPAPRCQGPGGPQPLSALLATSPPPYALRWAAQGSAGARQVLYAMARALASSRREDPGPDAWEQRLRELQVVVGLELARARGVGATPYVVVLPRRYHLEAAAATPGAPPSTAHQDLLDLVRGLGVEPIDPWDFLIEQLRAGLPADFWHGATEGIIDEHYGPAGRRVMAEWLAPRLGLGAR
jgi:hypothetical protein